jgi:hypothetical protein
MSKARRLLSPEITGKTSIDSRQRYCKTALQMRYDISRLRLVAIHRALLMLRHSFQYLWLHQITSRPYVTLEQEHNRPAYHGAYERTVTRPKHLGSVRDVCLAGLCASVLPHCCSRFIPSFDRGKVHFCTRYTLFGESIISYWSDAVIWWFEVPPKSCGFSSTRIINVVMA